jgi:Tol biopolymer transport system component
MKRILSIVFLASVILAGCTKDNTLAPYNPPYIPPTDTTKPPSPTQTPYGTVDAPYLVVSLLDYSKSEFKMEKYRVDGSARAKYLDDYFTGNHFIDNPDFSAKGDKFCYAEGPGIYILDINSRNRREVLGNVGGLESTEMSPDGSRIAYLNWNGDFTLDLNVVGSSGESTPVKLTNFENSFSSAGPPSFSPDGNKIAYTENPDLVVSDWNGANKIKVHECSGMLEWATYPIFSKDGTKLIYFLDLDYGTVAIVSSEIREGAGNEWVLIGNLTNHLISDPMYPVLSDDGSMIYFVAGSNIYKIPVAGGEASRVAYNITRPRDWQVVGLDFVER